jgi:hypothetical protein
MGLASESVLLLFFRPLTVACTCRHVDSSLWRRTATPLARSGCGGGGGGGQERGIAGDERMMMQPR